MLQFLHQAQSLLSINVLPFAKRDIILQNTIAQRKGKAQFDRSHPLDLNEHVLLHCSAPQVYTLDYRFTVRPSDHVVSCLTSVKLFASINAIITCIVPVRLCGFTLVCMLEFCIIY